MLKTVIYHGQKTEVRGRAAKGKEQQNYKSDQVSQNRQQREEEYKMSAVKVKAEGTGRADTLAVGCRRIQQKIIFKTTNQFKALS